MKILKNTDNLHSVLKNIDNKVITIVSAFASGTESVVDLLIKNNNKLRLIIGTINSFSSPDFFDHCLQHIDNENFSLCVDFGYQNSIHWKLYLIEPDTVIIGSANFTNIGLSLSRDTCVVIENSLLLNSYKEEISSIIESKNVIEYRRNDFSTYLEKYRSIHRRMQTSLIRSIQSKDLNEWLEDESNQLLPVFIWDSLHSKNTIKEAHELNDDSESELRDFFTYKADREKLPYEQGDMVLCLKDNGSYIDFYSFDRIIIKDNLHYIYSYKRPRYSRPFLLNDKLKKEIKERVATWYKEKISVLNRTDLSSLLKIKE